MTTEGENYWASPTSPPLVGSAGPPHALGAEFGFISRSGGVEPAEQRSRRGEGIALGVTALLILIAVVGLLATGPATAGTDPMSGEEKRMVMAAADIATVRLAARACPGTSFGSGFVVDGLLFTSGHLVEFDDIVKVDRPGQPVLASVLGTSRSHDVAVLDASSLVARPLGLASGPAEVGEPVMLAGHPGGAGLQVLDGVVVSYQSASSWGMNGDNVMLIDTGTEGGFSGGPVLDRDGDIVGMLAAVDKTTGLTVAIPVGELSLIVALADATWSSTESTSPVSHVAGVCGN
ncbi:MAG: trypsin-like peptidase domain-containing protein [Acidimicrobiales bacterium]|nr:trypsin-like peptidase domain-containing protein [Acidimicrobiales bacterium]